MLIAVIDDGVNKQSIPDLQFSIKADENGIFPINDKETNPVGHASICAAIIKKYAPHSQIGSIKVLDSAAQNGDCKSLISAICWCIENSIKIIHLSLGTISACDYSSLIHVINQAYKNNIIIIASCKNGSYTSYPASFSNVIGVKCGPLLNDDCFDAQIPNLGGIEFYASSSHKLGILAGAPFYGTTPLCNSFASPTITAKIYNLLQINPSMTFDDIKYQLHSKSTNKLDAFYSLLYKQSDWFSSVILLVKDISPIDTNYISYWNIKNVIYFQDDTALEQLTQNTQIPVVLYGFLNFELNELIQLIDNPLIFTQIVGQLIYKKCKKRFFLPTLLEDYKTDEKLINERPVIAFLNKDDFQMIPNYKKLKDMFEQKNYTTVLFSDYSIDVLLGAVFLNDSNHLYTQNGLLYATHQNAEIILIHANLKHISNYSPDIIVCDSETQSALQAKNISLHTAFFTDIADIVSLFLQIYDFICED